MVVRKVKVEVSRQVVWIWSVVCAERGRGMDNCLGDEVEAIAVILLTVLDCK